MRILSTVADVDAVDGEMTVDGLRILAMSGDRYMHDFNELTN